MEKIQNSEFRILNSEFLTDSRQRHPLPDPPRLPPWPIGSPDKVRIHWKPCPPLLFLIYPKDQVPRILLRSVLLRTIGQNSKWTNPFLLGTGKRFHKLP